MIGLLVGMTTFGMTKAERDSNDRYSSIDGFFGNAASPQIVRDENARMSVRNLAIQYLC